MNYLTSSSKQGVVVFVQDGVAVASFPARLNNREVPSLDEVEALCAMPATKKSEIVHANKFGTANFVGTGTDVVVEQVGSKFVAYVGGGILRTSSGVVCKYKTEETARKAAAKAINAAK